MDEDEEDEDDNELDYDDEGDSDDTSNTDEEVDDVEDLTMPPRESTDEWHEDEDMDEDDGEENDDEGTDDDMDAREDVAENPEIVWPVSACIRFHLIPNFFCRRTSSLTVMDLRPLETKTMTLAVLVFF